MFELIRNPSIDFMGKKKISLGLSTLLVLIGLFALIQIARGQANLGIDFTGGTALLVHFERPEPISEVRTVLSGNGFSGAQIQNVNGTSDLFIRVKARSESAHSVTESILALLHGHFAGNPLTIRQSIEIGPTIGSELAGKALVAIFFSLLGFILYIAVRFEFRFGLAAAISTFHNVIAVLGILYLLHVEINLLIVTSLLTLAGYSLTDTVVVFDRIREQMRRSVRQTPEALINSGINQVLSRTVVVSLTVEFVLFALLIGGGPVIHDFSLALFIGVLIGTYASIFVASPLLLILPGRRKGLGFAPRKPAPEKNGV